MKNTFCSLGKKAAAKYKGLVCCLLLLEGDQRAITDFRWVSHEPEQKSGTFVDATCYAHKMRTSFSLKM